MSFVGYAYRSGGAADGYAPEGIRLQALNRPLTSAPVELTFSSPATIAGPRPPSLEYDVSPSRPPVIDASPFNNEAGDSAADR
jgi:hypothetical protein